MKRLLKLSFWTVVFLLWIVAGFALCEYGERHLTRHDILFEYASPIIGEAEARDLEIFESTLDNSVRPPAEVEAKYPVLKDLEETTEEALKVLAEKWEGVIFNCDLEGTIIKRYAASSPDMIVQLAQKASTVNTISEILPAEHPEYGADVLFRFHTALDDWRNPPPPQPHVYGSLGPYIDYVIPLPDFPDAGFRFMFHPFQKPGMASPGVFVVLIQWRWQAFVGGYRSNYYESDAYPQYPKSEFWTNSRGFRDEEVTVPKPPGIYRIVCIGGSTTVEGPRNDLTYPKILQQLLRKHFNTDIIEVVNCGVDGGSIRGQVFRYDECLALEPDLVIHYNYVNDTGDLMNNVLKKTVLRTELRGRIIGRLAESKFLARRCRRLWSMAVPKKADYREEIEAILMPPLKELCGRTQQKGARFAVSSFAYPDIHSLPSKEKYWFRNIFAIPLAIQMQFDDYMLSADAFNEAARAFCEREGAYYVPVAEGITGGADTFTDTCHMHMNGIQKKAEIMFESLKELIAGDLGTLNKSGNTLN
ncbi:MAG: SGNH/GDSL hydrolase family protein [Candidatus Hydrogenedentes bacterium]|nr:SGNH/GDSL hydrolase family protein [Candidatus Hydrogenedentota bacterium]